MHDWRTEKYNTELNEMMKIISDVKSEFHKERNIEEIQSLNKDKMYRFYIPIRVLRGKPC